MERHPDVVRQRPLVWLVAAGCLLALATPAFSSDPESPRPSAADDRSLAERKLEFYRSRIREQRLFRVETPDRPLELIEEPLIRFENPVSRIQDAMLFVWTESGRPAAAMKCYHNQPQKSWGRTFVALSTSRVAMEIGGTRTWTPEEPGLAFEPLPAAPVPAAQPTARLAQMRQLAGQFEIIDHWGKQNPTDWRLRLLPTPLYRYACEDQQIVDGALFGYVLTTGPEALLLLEARRTDTGLEWQYAVARMTVFGLKFSRGGEQVAEFPRLEAWPPTGTYFHLAVPMEEISSSESEEPR